ncbi:MAG: 30S ribosomal protein S2 [Candidatus Omnitrophica bacterium]|nr:30S ribosomal protein S2 [Candidatus Omnitrophota bacterium]
MATTLVRQLLEAGVHFGHQTKRWNPKMKRFIFGSRSGIYIIDLEKTERVLHEACVFLEEAAARGQRVLFVGTKKQAKPILEAEAKRAGMPYVVNRWLGGTLTNFQPIKSNIDRLRELRKQREDGFFERISKKDAKRLSRQLQRLEEHFAGLADLDRLPGCLFIVDIKREDIAVREANRLTIPIVAICDTNSDPDLVTYPIPGNDDAIRSIQLITSLVTESVMAGRRRFEVGQQAAMAPEASAGAGAAASRAESDHDGTTPILSDVEEKSQS